MKLWWLWRKRDKELEKEIQHHLRMAADARVERGMSPHDARAGARREFGNVGLAKELSRDAWGWRWLEDLFEDLRYGLRTMRKSPGFTATAILTLALGIGANALIFSFISAALLRAIPVRSAKQLVVLRWRARTQPNASLGQFGDCESILERSATSSEPAMTSDCSFSEPFFRELQKRKDAFASFAAFTGTSPLVLSGRGAASTVRVPKYVTGEYFETLGIKPALGRLINHEDDSASAPATVVLSFSYWRSEFGGSADIVGKPILLNRVPFTVVGVAERQFDSLTPGRPIDLWIPLAVAPRIEVFWGNQDVDASYWWLVVVGKLKPGETREVAAAQLSALFQNETAHGPSGQPMLKPEDRGAIELESLGQGLTGTRTDLSKPLYTMMLAVGIVLLIACANVAGLMLARATFRQKEMALRFALGASKGRILRQLLTESLILSFVGGAIGMMFAGWRLQSIVVFLWASQHRDLPFTPGIDARALLFTGAVTILAGILFGLTPALRGLRVDLTPALKEGTGSGAQAWRGKRGWFSAANSLVVVQLALSIVALAGAGLLVRTLENLKNVNPGFDPKNVLTFSLDTTPLGYTRASSDNLFRELQGRLEKMPGVSAVSYSWMPLLAGGMNKLGYPVPGKPKNEPAVVDVMPVGPEFFHTMRIPLLAGRDFDATDFATAERIATERSAQGARVAAAVKSGADVSEIAKSAGDLPPTPAIVNQAMVRRYLAAGNPLGQRFGAHEGDPAIGIGKSSGFQVTGLVADAKFARVRDAVDPTVYVPISGGDASFSVRTIADPMKIVPGVRAMVSQMDSNLPVTKILTETDQIDRLIFNERLVARVSGVFGALALLLACIGLYGLISYEVARRTQEIGIRTALGAERRDVLRLVLAQGMRLVLVGAAVGVVIALALTRYATDVLFGVKAADPATYVWVMVLLFSVALIACFVPARRAMKVDPAVALRYE
ncbi:MAG TPA: ABC transporter permease [Candidatus Methylomirabilis sp.]|nr:ABC transporter permease [Candidatus Methylomirabilis sp.]